jgi:DNA-directed RNA polymerase subunit RPC12/RpoP
MLEMTAASAAENLERLAKDFEEVGTPGNAKILRFAASVLRRVASGELAPVIHAHWEWFERQNGNPLDGIDYDWGWRCSKCKEELEPDDYDSPKNPPKIKRCPYCDALMDEPVVSQTQNEKDDSRE